MVSGTEGRWVRVEVSCPDPWAEELAAEAAEVFGVGVEMLPAGFCLYLPGEEVEGTWERDLAAVIEEVRHRCFAPLDVSYRTSIVADEGWADRWKEHFKPLRVGSRFVVCPTWESFDADPRDLVIRMDPGRAFGTGHHETTRLCLERLEVLARDTKTPSPGSLLDVGTGSGILAIGAALLGFGPVVGVDVDPEAVEVARENVSLNSLTLRVEVRVGSVGEISKRFDVVVANLQAYPLMALAPGLVDRTGEGGRLLLSGILLEQERDVRDVYESLGFRSCARGKQGEWCFLEFQPY